MSHLVVVKGFDLGRFGDNDGSLPTASRRHGVERKEMDMREGDHVWVNVAPFIGSARRNKESVPCRVLAIHESHVDVQTEAPYREVSLRVARRWVEGTVEEAVEAALGAGQSLV